MAETVKETRVSHFKVTSSISPPPHEEGQGSEAFVFDVALLTDDWKHADNFSAMAWNHTSNPRSSYFGRHICIFGAGKLLRHLPPSGSGEPGQLESAADRIRPTSDD